MYTQAYTGMCSSLCTHAQLLFKQCWSGHTTTQYYQYMVTIRMACIYERSFHSSTRNEHFLGTLAAMVTKSANMVAVFHLTDVIGQLQPLLSLKHTTTHNSPQWEQTCVQQASVCLQGPPGAVSKADFSYKFQ